MVEALAQVPGVTSVAFANQLPLRAGFRGITILPEGRAPANDGRGVIFMMVTPQYFATMGIPLRAGQFLSEGGAFGDTVLVAINETAARRYWPDQNPVGRYGRMNTAD